MDIHHLRKDYILGNLDIANVEANPIIQFKKWFDEALTSEVNEPNAMVLSTISENNKPHSRVVLVKDISEAGFTFFTNYESNKALQMVHNPNASLLFFWPELERQVRIEGIVEKVEKHESETYFHSRPRGSQVGAHISPQSRVIPNRDFLEKRVEQFEKKFSELKIPLPDFWGGYVLKPTLIEFWQGRSSRLHDRILYTFEDNLWKIERLAP